MNAFDQAETHKDEQGNVCQLNHMDRPFTLQDALGDQAGAAADEGAAAIVGPGAITARQLADLYLREAMQHFNITADMAADGGAAVAGAPADQLVYEEDKSIMGNATVTYGQRHDGIPVWESGMVVQLNEQPMEVIGAQSSFKSALDVVPLAEDAPYTSEKLDAEALKTLLRLNMGTSVEIDHEKQTFIYYYRAHQRSRSVVAGPTGEALQDFQIPPVDESIEEGKAYIVTAVQFTVQSRQDHESGWLALIDANTGSILHLRSLQGCAMEAAAELEDMSLDDVSSASATAAASSLTVVFFDIGQTLGLPRFSQAGELEAIDIFPDVPEIFKELKEKNIRIGIISDPGTLDTSLINALLDDAGVLQYFEADLIVYGRKDSTTIFEDSAAAAAVSPSACVFVGENASERQFADDAGFAVVNSPDAVIGVVDPEATLAWVYLSDPTTKQGFNAVRPTGTQQALDRVRDLVSLRGLEPTAPGEDQALKGEYIEIRNVDGPNPTIPTSPSPGDFRFSVPTNDFGAVNAYHNCDRLFRLLEDFGFDVRQYFDGTIFPVPVDHRFHYRDQFGFFRSNVVNASAPGSALGRRSNGFRFALAALNTVVCMSTAWRVVLHEFGHAILWDHVGSPNFNFAHSAGDALAAILSDPDNQAPRNSTFPWTGISRSHTRSVDDFAWYGTRFRPFDGDPDNNVNPETPIDPAGYVAEQMLSSTLFRIYLAAGGGSADIATRRFASQYVAFLIFKAVGLMSPANNPAQPEGFADLLMQADNGVFTYRGTSSQIGVLRKVIRWGFEMQGAYRQPPPLGPQGKRRPGTTDQVGNPSQVDVFVNDGRDGHYDFSAGALNSTDIWNRQAADDGTVHQPPVLGRVNHAYVRVSNRGLSAAGNVVVEAFQSPRADGQTWPDDWQPLATSEVQVPGVISPGNDVIAGPFSWTPSASMPTLLASASATGDVSSLGRFSTANPIDNSRLVPCDNNIAQRTMQTTVLPFGPAPVG